MSKLTEEETKLRLITPAIDERGAGWSTQKIQMEQTFTDGRIIVDGNKTRRGEKKKYDFLLNHNNNRPLAIVEAKDNQHSVADGMQQALEYAEILDVPFAYSSNGAGFREHDRLTGLERELKMNEFPTPDDLWSRYEKHFGVTEYEDRIINEPYYFNLESKQPRYYQRIAINRTVDAVSRDQKRILLAMATGTGKTFTAFQIIWRLWKSGAKKRILFLADRNILVDQTIQNDFKHFKDSMHKIGDGTGSKVDTAHEIYLSLYQQLAGDDGEESFREFQPDFFDLIVIDECHRGSAKEESQWRKVLEYFSSATQIGMTATPKETENVSNEEYFGAPIYRYSLVDGINDGFLAPYKVLRVPTNVDAEGYVPEDGKRDINGELIETRQYSTKDFDKTLVIDERTKAVAERITEWLKKNDRFAKTIVFCVDQDHAERMRQELNNLNADLVQKDSRYVMRITGDDNVGKRQLDNFIDPAETYPVIATTSMLLTTGVDAQTCKLIVLDKEIESDIEFKQIIGRGTRIREDFGKNYFTIMDFRGVTRKFANDDFWSDPEQVKVLNPGDSIEGPRTEIDSENKDDFHDGQTHSEGDGVDPETKQRFRKKYINGVAVKIYSERVQYYDENGKLITENLTTYTKENVHSKFANFNEFLSQWNQSVHKKDMGSRPV
ncbi:MAG: DEAD/DEAH box helicase family protein [Bifidobacteriaceae bacterium]|jgi:type I restriction enzyme R subunit|nr:DEAD/DEAH box helicase family protein [Bifidobacteriaceae bacterium]